jgi:hypothetical protein
MINDELNLFNHMQQIRKLKAGMCELIGDDAGKLDRIQERYLQYSILHLGEKPVKKGKNQGKFDFKYFLERDERDFLLGKKRIHGSLKSLGIGVNLAGMMKEI